MQLTDTHCHLYFNDYMEDREAVLNRAWETGLVRILIPGIDLASSRAAIDLAGSHPSLFASIGIHPNSSSSWDSQTLECLEMMAAYPKVVAIGEIGLDYYRDKASRDHQKRVFFEQLLLAERINLPVVIHTRNTAPDDRSCIDDTLAILEKFKVRGVLHSFSGNLLEAKCALALGFWIGVSGPVTFKNSADLHSVVASVPLDRLLIETDGPFLTPHPHRGKRNEPAYVEHVAEKISAIRNQPFRVVAQATTTNARELFRWSGEPLTPLF